MTKIFSGCRESELFGLAWENVDFATGVISISQTRQYVSGVGHVVSPYAKNDSSERGITLPQKILGLVYYYQEEQKRLAKLLDKTWTPKGFVFVSELCNPIPLSTLSEWMSRFRARNSIMHLTPKDLRHLHATILGKAKIPVKNASTRMGHAKTSTTLDIYSHDFQDSDTLIAQALDDLVKL